MRLFAAVDPAPAARAAAARAARALAGRLAGDAPAGRPERDGPADRLESDRPGRIRWVAPERLHVTLRFLGEVTEADADAVRGVLRTPFETGAFTARVSRLERFPASGAPRVVWLGIDEGRDGFAAVRTELDRRLASVGWPPETRPFRVHLTLGRVQRWPARSRHDVARALSDLRPETPRWLVDRVTLYESRQTHRGARYVVLESASLRRSAGA